MCGITGVINFKSSSCSEEVLAQMTGAISHRGPDEETFYSDDYLSLGFRRLSIIDIEHGTQPLWSQDGDILVVVNGEIYNHLELRQKLESKYDFKTNSDSEVVVHLYNEYGTEAFSQLNGMFAILIWDKRNDSLVLARDRLGIKPFYYSEIENGLIFGSELKSLLAHPQCSREIRWSDLEVLNLQQKSPVSTYVENVNFLEAGSFAVLNKNEKLKITKYWDIESSFNSNTSSSAQDIIAEYKRLVDDSVKMRLMSEVPVGIFLSGGIDSSIITAIAAKYNKNVHCFSVVERTTYRSGDIQQAIKITEELGVPFYPILYDTEAIAEQFTLNDLEQMVYLIESPRFDPEWLFKSELHRAAKQYVPDLKVILLGQGADEFAGGYSNYLGAPYKSWQEYISRAVVPDITSNLQLQLDIPERLRKLTKAQSKVAEVGYYHQKMKLLTYQLQYFNLWHEDRSSSIHSIESRVPFLDHRIVELLASVPEEFHEELFWDKKIVRECLSLIEGDYPRDKLKVPFFATDDISSINEFVWKIAANVYTDFKQRYIVQNEEGHASLEECENLYDNMINRRHDMYESAWKLIEVMCINIFSRLLREPQDFRIYQQFNKNILPKVEPAQWQELASKYSQPAVNNNAKPFQLNSIISVPKNCEILNPLSEKEGSTCLILAANGKQVRRMDVPDDYYWLVQVLDELGQESTPKHTLEDWRKKVNKDESTFYPVVGNLVASGFIEIVGEAA